MYFIFSDIFFIFISYNLILLLIGLFFKLAVAFRLVIKSLYTKFYIIVGFFLFFSITWLILIKLNLYYEFLLFFNHSIQMVVFFFMMFFILGFLVFFFFVKFSYVKLLPFFLCLNFVLFSNLLYLFVEDFFTLYIVLEFHTLLLYILYNITLPFYSGFYIKSGIKFFILSVFTSLFFLLGLFFIYYSTGTIVFFEIKLIFSEHSNIIYRLGLNLVYAVFCFKLGLFPFYTWMLEIFGSLNSIFFLIYVFIAKIPIFFIFVKLIYFFDLTSILCVISVFSIFYGIFCIFVENDVRLFIIYSSMVQYGVLFLSLLSKNIYIFYGIFYNYLNYVLIFNFLFVIFLIIGDNTNFDLRLLIGLKYNSYFLVFILVLSLFSVIGVPPTLGFFGKYYLYYGLLVSNHFYVVFFLIIVSLLSSVYYFNIIRLLFFMPIKDAGIFMKNFPLTLKLYAISLVFFIFIFYFIF